MTLRAYIVGSSYYMDIAVLVFATTAREARNLGADILVHDYGVCEWTDVRARWLRDGAPAWWHDDITEPTVVEPEGCESCAKWYPEWRPTPQSRVCPMCRAWEREDARMARTAAP